jgi:hypothetical protein
VSGQFFPQALESSHTFRAQSVVIGHKKQPTCVYCEILSIQRTRFQRQGRLQDTSTRTDALLPNFQRLSVAIRTHEAAYRCILRDSFNTEDSFFRETVGSKTLGGAQMSFIIFQRAIGCNRDARSSQEMYIARFFRYSGLAFREKLDSKTLRGAQTHYVTLSEGNRM